MPHWYWNEAIEITGFFQIHFFQKIWVIRTCSHILPFRGIRAMVRWEKECVFADKSRVRWENFWSSAKNGWIRQKFFYCLIQGEQSPARLNPDPRAHRPLGELRVFSVLWDRQWAFRLWSRTRATIVKTPSTTMTAITLCVPRLCWNTTKSTNPVRVPFCTPPGTVVLFSGHP